MQKKLNEVRREKAELEKLIKSEQISRSSLEAKLSGIQEQNDLVSQTSAGVVAPLCELREEEEEEEIEEEDEAAAALLLASMK